MDEREQRKRKERSDLIWTFLIIGGFLVAWPIGLVLAILRGRGLLPAIGMNTPTRQESWRDYKVNPTSSAGQKAEQKTAGSSAATNWTAQAQAQAERTRQQAQYWAEQARVQAERTRQRAVQWAVPIQTQRAQQANPTAAEQAKRAQQQAARQQAAENAARERAARQAAAQKAAKQKNKEKSKEKLRFGKPMFITGLCVGAVGAIALADDLAGVTSLADFLRDGFFSFGVFAVGIYLIIHGFLRARQSKRLQEYNTIIKPNGEYYSIHELADRTGRPYRQVLADLQKMVELGVWEQAWIDRKHGRLMFTEYSAEQMVSGAKTENATAETVSDKRAEEVLKRIRDDNDRIADQAISRKIDRIELLTGEIFRYLSKHPEREGELRTFMDYYLPQTLKILETYAQLEAQGVETDNIRKAKDQISDVLDQLTESYERQLDKLFDTDVLDISADIDVMKKMLQNDGLAADELAVELEKQQ